MNCQEREFITGLFQTYRVGMLLLSWFCMTKVLPASAAPQIAHTSTAGRVPQVAASHNPCTPIAAWAHKMAAPSPACQANEFFLPL